MPRITITPEELGYLQIPDYLKEFYEEGKEAKVKGVRFWKCPYKGILPLEKAWMSGWSDQEIEMMLEGGNVKKEERARQNQG